jgi:peptidoglycan/xylan/chitin deacetylase (PgdA/CDA1 family)
MRIISVGLQDYYQNMREKYPSALWFGDGAHREIALTFDDGPHEQDTPRVLDTLSQHEIKATFFLIGRFVEKCPKLVQRIHQSGHQLGIHGYRHIPFPLESKATLQSQLVQTRNRIAEICNISPEAVRAVRPPYGAFNTKTLTLLSAWDYQPVMWNCIPPHWMQPLSWTIQQMYDQICPGSIIVLHDGHGHGTKVVRILDWVVPTLKEQGYHFVTVEGLQKNNLAK